MHSKIDSSIITAHPRLERMYELGGARVPLSCVVLIESGPHLQVCQEPNLGLSRQTSPLPRALDLALGKPYGAVLGAAALEAESSFTWGSLSRGPPICYCEPTLGRELFYREPTLGKLWFKSFNLLKISKVIRKFFKNSHDTSYVAYNLSKIFEVKLKVKFYQNSKHSHLSLNSLKLPMRCSDF